MVREPTNCLDGKSVRNRILLNTLKHVIGRASTRRLLELHLTRYFTTVELDDGSVGACMSYYRLPDAVLSVAQDSLETQCKKNLSVVEHFNALVGIICDFVRDGVQQHYIAYSLAASVASALSVSAIHCGGDKDFHVLTQPPFGWADDAESGLVVGFGGLLDSLLAEPRIKAVHTIDLSYEQGRDRFEFGLARLRQRFPTKKISISVQMEHDTDVRQFDFISITGSTLCNGTLEYFLDNARSDAIIVLQGQSASMHPKIFFDSGINWVATTLKPRILTEMARGDHSGEKLRTLLDGGLPQIFLTPNER